MSKRQKTLDVFYSVESSRVIIDEDKRDEATSIENDPLNSEDDRHWSNKNDIGNYIELEQQIADIAKKELLENHWMPPEDFDFPKGNDKRSFQINWLKKFSWLKYSNQKKGAFCIPCVLFASATQSNKQLGALVKRPFTNYQKALETFTQHEKREYHRFSMIKAASFLGTSQSSNENVVQQCNRKDTENRENNRKFLSEVIDLIILFGSQNIPMRGHRENFDMESEIDKNNGNFLEVLKFIIKKNPDSILHKHFMNAAKNAQYISPEIQNDLINCCGSVLQSLYVEEANKAGVFSVIADEATDCSGKEVMSISIRYVYEKKIKECFLGFSYLSEMTGKSIANALLKFLQEIGLDITKLKAQCYDGAASMSGCVKGAQAVVHETCPTARYIHCASHQLNLALSKASTVTSVGTVISKIQDITFYFLNSPKRKEILQRIIDTHSSFSHNKLIKLCLTRWVEKHHSIDRFNELFLAIIESLDEIKKVSKDADAAAFKAYMCTFEFIFVLKMVSKFSDQFIIISSSLQKPTIDLMQMHAKISRFIEFIEVAINDEKQFNRIFEDSFITLGKIDGLSESTPSFDKNRYPTARQQYHYEIYKPYLREVKDNLKLRFNHETKMIYRLQWLMPAHFPDDKSEFDRIFDDFIDDLGCTRSQFENEYLMWTSQFSSQDALPSTIEDTLLICNPNFEPNIFHLLQLFATIPVTTCTAERSFSTLKRVKTYLRNTMGEKRVTGLALLNIYQPTSLNKDKIIEKFKMEKRRLDF